MDPSNSKGLFGRRNDFIYVMDNGRLKSWEKQGKYKAEKNMIEINPKYIINHNIYK